MLSAAVCASAWAAPLSEYEVKAAFLFNFAKFVDWPAKPSGEIRLCLVGADPFDGALSTFENRMIGDKRFVSGRIGLRSDAELLGCDMLYIARSEQDRLASLLRAVKDLPILTVGDGEGYARLGVMINFYLDQGKVRFEINPNTPKRAGLRLSAKLMQLGRLVRTPE
jgi:hypothetical protein